MCPETSENHEKTILGVLWNIPGSVSGSHLGPKDEKSSKKDEKGRPLGPPLGSIGGQFFIILTENLIFLGFFSRRFSELVFLWILGGLGTSFFMIFSMIFRYLLRFFCTSSE